MDHVKSLKCLICGQEYSPNEVEYVCPQHGDDGILDVQYDYDLIASRISPASLAKNRDYTIWRYQPLLPIEPDSPVPPLAVGWTPLYRTDRLAAGLGLKHLWVKDDGRAADRFVQGPRQRHRGGQGPRARRRSHHHGQHRQRGGGSVRRCAPAWGSAT